MRRILWSRILIGVMVVAACGCVSGQGGETPANPPGGAELLCETPVKVASGLLQGREDEEGGTCSWKGVPYATPPVGELRWKAPQPAASWDGVREATAWGSDCIQSRLLARLHSSPANMSEDCLFLNIWRPRKPGKLPVMVWLHGGGYFCGMGASPMYHGDRLSANQDVVVVNVNYRLSAFGFLFHEGLARENEIGSTGNYGTLDQIQALKWVKENIAAFGGDPQEVTIFGESAGGWSVCTLLATPLAKGLFHRAIIESGACNPVWSKQEGAESGRWAARRLDCEENDLSCMRSKDAGEVLNKLEIWPHGYVNGKGFRYLNHVDGDLLTDRPCSMISSAQFNNVPVILGYNRDELQPIIYAKAWQLLMTRSSFEERLRKEFAEEADAILRLYPAEAYPSPAKAYAAIISDRIFDCPACEGVGAIAQQQPATYYYRFDYSGMRFGKKYGVCHAMELPFVFQGFDRKPFKWLYGAHDLEKAAALAHVIQGYWANFARSGDPNGEGLPDWPVFRTEDPRIQLLNTESGPGIPDNMERCAFWSQYDKTHPSIFAPGGLK